MAKKTAYIIYLNLICLISISTAGPGNIITIHSPQNDVLLITIDSQAHTDYGFSYPVTYQVNYSGTDTSLTTFLRYQFNKSWQKIEKRSSANFFNGEETVRYNHETHTAYISVGFSRESDSIFIRITDSDGGAVNMNFIKIPKYYDNRVMSVTLSADDMAGWSQSKFERALGVFRSYHLWTTCAINTGGANSSTYDYIQRQLEAGYMEAGCHSRTHPSTYPYDDYESEIVGNRDDIIDHLVLPALFKSGTKEYVYSWIAPNGYVDDVVDSIAGREKFIVTRLYVSNCFGYTGWNDATGYYQPVGVTRAFDPPRERLGWGIGSDDIDNLNGAFDQAYLDGSTFHTMCHPNVIEWDSSYVWDHLEYISDRKDVWYVSFGHLYLYHMAYENNEIVTGGLVSNRKYIPQRFFLKQNYPNPFNPLTTIEYQIDKQGEIRLEVFDILGRKIKTLISEIQPAGEYKVNWNGENMPSGIYLYRLTVNGSQQVKKMALVR